MSDLIKREDAIEAVAEVLSLNRFASFKDIKDFGRFAERMLRNTPSADRPQGEWIEHKWIEYNEELMLEIPMHNYECSKCHSILHEASGTNFCPNCGAKMKGADDE